MFLPCVRSQDGHWPRHRSERNADRGRRVCFPGEARPAGPVDKLRHDVGVRTRVRVAEQLTVSNTAGTDWDTVKITVVDPSVVSTTCCC